MTFPQESLPEEFLRFAGESLPLAGESLPLAEGLPPVCGAIPGAHPAAPHAPTTVQCATETRHNDVGRHSSATDTPSPLAFLPHPPPREGWGCGGGYGSPADSLATCGRGRRRLVPHHRRREGDGARRGRILHHRHDDRRLLHAQLHLAVVLSRHLQIDRVIIASSLDVTHGLAYINRSFYTAHEV